MSTYVFPLSRIKLQLTRLQLDRQLATDNVYVDSIILQTLHDYPRWKSQGALLPYKPLAWEKIHDDYKDDDGFFTGLYIFGWSNVWNTKYVTDGPKEYEDFLRPEFKNKLVLTYPNDDVRTPRIIGK